MRLSPALSSYLDFTRFTAAFAVLLDHMKDDGFAVGWIPLAGFSHEAVMIFFVMSGFIIHTSTAARGWNPREYVVARASRVYSVALPAVIFSTGLAMLAAWVAPQVAQAIPMYRPFAWRDVAAALLFFTESWPSWTGFDAYLSLNGPYWSLCYEVWYYVIFALFVFCRSAWRWVLPAIAAVVAGPAIMVLFPIWLMGAWLASRWDRLPRPGLPAARAWFAASITVIVLTSVLDFDEDIKRVLHNTVPGFWRLESSQRLVTDHLLGAAVVVNIWAFPSIGERVQQWFARHRAAMAAWAGFSFTLYLFHRPISSVAGHALQRAGGHGVGVGALALVLIVGCCWLISFVTERRLPAWRRAFTRLVAPKGAVATAGAVR